MAAVVTTGDQMSGSVSAHAGHIVGYNNYEDDEGNSYSTPIYCSGHSVSGQVTEGSSKVLAHGRPVATVGDEGSSNCPCDGRGFTITGGSAKVFIEGRPVARSGDSVNIHGSGTGRLSSRSDKIIVGD